jgi:NADPH:quinone reductase-like Zn-dependent oxidoreductase
MKAVIYKKYGGTDMLQYTDLPVPVPKPGEVLIQVKAINLNPRDVSIRQGNFKFMTGRKFPKLTGADFSGTVVGLGENCKICKLDDDVFGYTESLNSGTSAEYISMPEKYLALKPVVVRDEQAATLGCTHLTALQALRDKGQIKSGDKILIYGAAGGVGSAAIQLASYFKAEVTAVSKATNEVYCLQQETNRFLAYNQTNIFSRLEKYDIFFQVYSDKGSIYPLARNLLKPGGVFI